MFLHTHIFLKIGCSLCDKNVAHHYLGCLWENTVLWALGVHLTNEIKIKQPKAWENVTTVFYVLENSYKFVWFVSY